MRWAASLDMYRKVPTDLLEGTKRGSVLSTLAVVVMATLFYLETKAYLYSSWTTDLSLDSNKDSRVRVNFNITMLDLKCEYTVIDVVSVLGTEQNATTHVTKWRVDGDGIRRQYSGRNKQQHDILLKDDLVTETIDELYENGEDAINLDPTTLQFARNENEYLFVDFYASWCSHCRDLAPTWETLAEVMDAAAEHIVMEQMDGEEHQWTEEDYNHALKVERPVLIAKVDCVQHQHLCREQNIRAYPTLRMFIDGEASGDYQGHRTVTDMADWLVLQEEAHKADLDQSEKSVQKAAEAARKRLDISAEERDWNERMQRHRHNRKDNWDDGAHPGCQLAGHIMLDRVPGNFHIMARSNHHDLVPHMTNVSHMIHSLSVGEPFVRRLLEKNRKPVPAEVWEKFYPMNGNTYVTKELHEAYHHYLKVVTTDVDGLEARSKARLKVYQVLQNSQLAFYRNDLVPEAKFIYDLSPIAVAYREKSRHWYDYLTSLMAIIGGTFTVVGMLESGINAAVSRKRRNYY